MNRNEEKEKAFNKYINERRKRDKKNGYFHSILQLIASNGISIFCIYSCLTSKLQISLIAITIFTTLFAIGLDYTFYKVYIENND